MTHQEACDLLMPCKTAMAEAFTPVAQALVINKEISKIAHIVRRGDMDGQFVKNEIISEAEAYGFYSDVGIGIVNIAISKALLVKNWHDDEKAEPSGPEILSKIEFVKGLTKPDYVIDGILQRRFIYSMTGQTGHAKTAIALHVAKLIGSQQRQTLGKYDVESGNVLYFVGENPDEVRIRVISDDIERRKNGENPDKDNISFIPGVFDISQIMERVAQTMAAGLSLVVVDTSAAYFLGDDEINNSQAHDHACMFRELVNLPGGPCVLVLCHPTKWVIEPSQLLPRGGGAFLAQIDGNLTAWKKEDDVTILHHGKMRGPGFEPISFRLEQLCSTELTDTKGRMLKSVRAVPISDTEEKEQAADSTTNEDRLMAALLHDSNRSIAELAVACGWVNDDGSPLRAKVQRTIHRLENGEPKIVRKYRHNYVLTEEGKKIARGDD